MSSRFVSCAITALIVMAAFVAIVDLGSMKVRAPTNVSGSCYDGAGPPCGGPWTVAGSPYVFKGDVVVPAGQKLTIEPGATVHFEKYYNLTVDGYLSANGTGGARITFKSKPPVVLPGEWGSIRINASGHASIRYSDIMHGDDAIHLLSDGNTIRDSNITTNVNGINIGPASGNTVLRNNFTANAMGVQIDAGSFNDVTENRFDSNTLYDVNLLNSANNNSIADNTMTNGMWGVRLFPSDNNTISGNNMTTNYIGIFADIASRDNVMRDNYIFNSTFHGIFLKPTTVNNTVQNNTIILAGNCVNLESSGNRVSGNTISQCTKGVRIVNGSNNTVTANDISGSTDGVYVYNSSYDNNVTGNNLTLNNYGITIATNSNRTVADGNNISSSTQAGVRVISSHFISASGNTFFENLNAVSITQSSNIVVADNLILNGTGEGIVLDTASVVGIAANVLWNNSIGIKLISSSGNTIAYNNVSHSLNNALSLILSSGNNLTWNELWDNTHAIALSSSNGNLIMYNNVSSTNVETVQLSTSSFNDIMYNNITYNTLYGVRIDSTSNNNTVSWNNISANGQNGIKVDGSQFTIITDNTVSYNGIGINITGSSGSVIYHNNIIGNAVQAFDNAAANTWNDSYPSGGNYWSDYGPTCQDWHNGSVTPQTTGDWDGICDFQYDIDGDSADFYPLKYRYGAPIPTDKTPPIIWNEKPADLSTVQDALPSIGVNYTDPSGIDPASVRLEVDGADETPSSTVLQDGTQFLPGAPLTDGPHAVYLEARDTVGNYANISWGFTVQVAPTITNKSPADGSTVSDSTPAIGANYSDNTAIDVSSVTLRVDGNIVTPTSVTGTGVTYIPGTALTDALHTVVLEVDDTFGNTAIASWSFTIHSTPPAISNLVPALGSETNTSFPLIGASFSDLAGIDTGSVLIQVDGADVTSQAAVTATGFTFTPAAALANGLHQVYVEVSDTAGNKGTSLWTFTVNATTPIDSDGDGLPDDWEMQHFGDLNETGSGDPDDDGLTNLREYQEGTDPLDPDTDDDGINDGDEVDAGTDPLVPEAKPDSSGWVIWVVIIVVVIIVILLLLLFFTGRLRFGKKAGIPPPPDDFDRAKAEREIDIALGEAPPPPEDLGEGAAAEGAPVTAGGVSAEEYGVVEEPVEEEVAEEVVVEEVPGEGEEYEVVYEEVVEEVPEDAAGAEEVYEEVIVEEVVEEEPAPGEPKPGAEEPKVAEKRRPLPLPLWAKRSQAKAVEEAKAEPAAEKAGAREAEGPPGPKEAGGPAAEEKVVEKAPAKPRPVAEPAGITAAKKPEEPRKPEAKEKRPPKDEKQRLKKIAEEIDEILEFDEPADADIKKTIKDVPEPKKKKRRFWG